MGNLTGIQISSEPEDLLLYGFDASGLSGAPAMVAWPESTEHVVRLIKHASDKGMAIVPRGAGTGMTAGSVPTSGSIAMSFERMARVLELNAADLNVLVEPGIINAHLQDTLALEGLFYPPDPASMKICTIGGNVAENAGGPRALKYGVTRDYVMEIEAVLPSGDVITTGVRTHKGVVGYDLTRLLVGSEGTLAVMTKIRLKVLPNSGDIKTLIAIFDSVESAGKAVAGITAAGIVPRTLEFMDRWSIEAVEDYKPAGLPKGATALLLIELDGHPAAIEDEATRVADVCVGLGAEVRTASDDAQREKLWDARRSISPALHGFGMRKISEDVVVPRSRLAEMLVFLDEISERSGVRIINFGHAGDGNIHVNIMASKTDEEHYKRAVGLVREMFTRVLELGGTISGEHGVGLTKAKYLDMEIKKRELDLMRGVKELFDPKGMLNPGKIFS
jgi:glycolate oxidase